MDQPFQIPLLGHQTLFTDLGDKCKMQNGARLPVDGTAEHIDVQTNIIKRSKVSFTWSSAVSEVEMCWQPGDELPFLTCRDITHRFKPESRIKGFVESKLSALLSCFSDE